MPTKPDLLDPIRLCTKCQAERAYRSHTWCPSCTRSDYVGRAGGLVSVACLHCGDRWECTAAGVRRRLFCSRACKESARKIADKLAREQMKPEARACRHCGNSMPRSMRIDAAYCCERCNQAAHNATRKASWKTGERQERVSRAYIIERDAGRCHLCGKRPKLSELHLDHVVPLARGGTHDAANLRVACARCNLSKRAGSRGEQLSLVG